MVIETKFDVGDIVWLADRRRNTYEAFECPFCKGTGVSILGDGSQCLGRYGDKYECLDGIMHLMKFEKFARASTVSGLLVDVDDGGTLIEYRVKAFGDIPIDEKDMFTSEAECRAAIDNEGASENEIKAGLDAELQQLLAASARR